MHKKNIVKKNHEFQKILKKEKKCVSKYLVIYYANNSFNYLRVGLSIPKKIVKLAVNRNRIRRQLRNILDTWSNWEVSKDIIIITRKNFVSLEYKSKIDILK